MFWHPFPSPTHSQYVLVAKRGVPLMLAQYMFYDMTWTPERGSLWQGTPTLKAKQYDGCLAA